VALAAKELERALTRMADSQRRGREDQDDGGEREALDRRGREDPDDRGEREALLAADARLIREQVGRCRAILEQMAQGAGTVGESVATCTLDELLGEALVGVRDAPEVQREVPDGLGQTVLRLPPRAVSQALRSLITNAQDASPPSEAVMVSASCDERTVELAIRDRGAGISREILERIGEPFFTTKAPGRGMGLGLFLARAVVEAVGGTLHIQSTAGEGTEVRVALPTDVSPAGRGPRIS
jgi:two-component system sensor histidine kinase RegB